MGVTTPKSPNLRETDTADPRYTDLSNFAKRNLGVNVPGQDLLSGGVLQLPISESLVKQYIVDNDLKIGDRVLAGNRVGRITDIQQDAESPTTLLFIEVTEENMPLPIGAVEADENFIDPRTRRVDHIIGVVDGATPTAAEQRGGTTFGLTLDNPAVVSEKRSNPASWGAIAQAARKYTGIVPVDVVFDAFSDAGVTDFEGDLIVTPEGGGAAITVTTDASGDATVQLEPGVVYTVSDAQETVAVQGNVTNNQFRVPLDGTELTVVCHNCDDTPPISDRRLKENITPDGEPIDGVQFYTWNWNQIAQEVYGKSGSGRGVIADEVEHLDGIVTLDKHGYQNVNYAKLDALLMVGA